jgi:type I restriction enzyme S subunit
MRRPYPRYRDSGVEWLGEVPDHWELMRLGRIGSFFKGGGGTKEDETDGGLPCVRYGDLYTQHEYLIRHTRAHIAEDAAANYQELEYGDVLFAGSGETIDEIGKSAANLIDGRSYCGGDVIILRPAVAADATYMGYAADCQPSVYQKACMGRGVTVMHIYSRELKQMLIPQPPLDEQRAIAEFLDRETSKIDGLVGKKRLLIERLKEYRQALITRAVTRGLPPDAARVASLDPQPRLKPSGAEWLGEIPDHWELRQLGRIGSFFKGGGGTKEDETEAGVPCVRYGDLYTQHEYLIRHTRAHIAEDATANYRALEYGDVLFAGSGETIDEIGRSAVNLIEGPAYCGGDVIIFRPTVETDATYLGYAADCQPSVHQKARMGRGVTVMHIYGRELKRMLIPVPPLEEQRAIAAFLDEKLERIDTLVSSVEAAIERLAEYRAALITAAVTGKIDVRGGVPAEPERVGA